MRKIAVTAIMSVCVALIAGSIPAVAQGGSHIQAVRELGHDTSPPLDQIPALPPEAGPKQIIPLRPVRGPFASRPQPQADQALQSSATTSLSTTSGQNFLGIGTGLSGFTVQYIPPDTNGAAGATQFVQWVNASFAVFSKSNGSVVYGPAAGNTLWSGMAGTAGRACARNNSGDPIAQYDKQAGRWVMMQPVFKSPYYICVAVSTTSDATGSWNLYAFPVPNSLFPDYPKLGVWPDGYTLTYNQFQGNTFLGAAACSLDRANMLIGNSASMICNTSVGSQYGSLLPSDLDGSSPPPSGAPEYFLAFDGNLASLDLFTFVPDFAHQTGSFSGPVNIPVDPFNEACGGAACIPQQGTSQQLDSLGDRLMYRLAYRDFPGYEDIVVSQSVAPNGGNTPTAIRWYELRNSGTGFGVYQQGSYAPDSTSYRWMPSIAMDKLGDIALGYSVSSGSMTPTIRVTGRVPIDTLGTMESESDLLGSIQHGYQTTYTRWGDYSSMSIDPTDDCTFWYTNEYQPANGAAWSTRIASFAFPACTGGGSPTVSSVTLNPASVTAGTSSTGTVTLSAAPSSDVSVTLSSSDSSVASVPSSVTIVAGSTSANFTVSTPNTVTSSTNVTITASYNNSSAQATLTVNPASSGGSFTLTASSSAIAVTPGSSSTDTIIVTPSGFTGSVSLSITGLPKFTNASFSPNPVSVSGNTAASSTLTVSANRHASATSSPVTLIVTGTSGGSSSSVTLSLTVQ